jgi:carboxyl-terminal processing protease
MDKELKKIIDGGAKGIILDLRNNLGGTVIDAVDLCDLFLDSGVIVTVKGRSNNKESFEEFLAKDGGYTEIPMIVLINGYSASASELTAGALKDNNRAVLVGEKSFGKGTVQVLERLSDGSGIKFTTAKYYLPSGVTIDGVGVQPDILVPLTPEDKEDLQLNRAIEEIKKMIEKDALKN